MIGASELLEDVLARIVASQGTLNAFRVLRPKAARAEALARAAPAIDLGGCDS
jgi:Asp-tRNA(Asn)/Glu-tRNA(Gln) amidotransferase A subunit family amidase